MILVDTNVWSEVTKPSRNPRVVDWLRAHDKHTMLSVIVAGEIEQGIAMTSGPEKRRVLTEWKRELLEDHADRIVEFDLQAALKWGELAAPFRRDRRNGLVVDFMLAAQAITRDFAIATRNGRDFPIEGITVIDPWVD
jgi:toxin FitB